MKTIGIIGGGVSGLIAAITAAKQGALVTVFEKKDRIGKKILVTGNGRCNFTNMSMSEKHYYCEDSDFVKRALEEFGNKDLISFFNGLGLLSKEKNGYVYPACEQASSVLDVLRYELKSLSVNILTDTEVKNIKPSKNGFNLTDSNNKSFHFDRVIVACGGNSGLSKNETSNGYDLCKRLGHKVNRLYPALTQIMCNGLNFKSLAGVREDCNLYVFSDEELLMNQSGEVLFADYGLSGIVTFQVSHLVAKLLGEKKDVRIMLDLLPNVSPEDLELFISSKYLLHPDLTLEELFTGLLNKKLNIEIIKLFNKKPSDFASSMTKEEIVSIALRMKEIVVVPCETGGFDKSQVTAGGIPTCEITDEFESRIVPGLFISGEMLDVDGICGGYNIQWAATGGYIAGLNSSK